MPGLESASQTDVPWQLLALPEPSLPHHLGMKPHEPYLMPQEQGSSTAREHCSCGCAFHRQPFGVRSLFHLKANPASESSGRGIFYILSSYCGTCAHTEKYHLLTKNNSRIVSNAPSQAEVGSHEQNSSKFVSKMFLISTESFPWINGRPRIITQINWWA